MEIYNVKFVKTEMDPLNLVKIKNPFRSFQTSPQVYQIVRVAKLSWCQIVRGAKLSAVSNCPGAKLSAVPNCPGAKLAHNMGSAILSAVPTCPGAKLS